MSIVRLIYVTVTADQIGSSAISSRGVVTPSSHIVFKPRDFLVPVPPDDPVDDEDEEIDDPPPTTPVEAVEETDEVPIVAPPTVTHDTANTLYTDLAGPRGPAPKEIDMINANPNSPAPQKPEEKSRLRGALVPLAGVAIVLVIVVTIGLRKPVDDNSVPPPPPPPIVHATEVADATPPAAPPKAAPSPLPRCCMSTSATSRMASIACTMLNVCCTKLMSVRIIFRLEHSFRRIPTILMEISRGDDWTLVPYHIRCYSSMRGGCILTASA